MKRLLIAAALAALAAPVPAYDLTYSLALDQYKNTRRLTNTLFLTQQLSGEIAMNVNTSFSADRSDDLDRFLDNRSGRAWISWTPSRSVEIATSLARTIQTEERFGETILDQVDNTATGEVRFRPAQWISTEIGLGSHFLDYENVSGDSTVSGHDEGGVRNASVSLSRSVFSRLSTSLSLGEQRTLGRQFDTGSDDLVLRMTYLFPEGFEGGSLEATAGATRVFTSYADSQYSHREQDWSHSLTITTPALMENLSLQVSTDWSWNNRYWDNPADTTVAGDPRDRLERARGISGRLLWSMMDDLDLEFTLARSFDRNDRKRTSPGVPEVFEVYDVSDDRLFSARVSYTPGDSRVTFERSIQLYRFDSEGTWEDQFGFVYEDNSDRDEQRQLLSLAVEMPFTGRLVVRGQVQGQRVESVYLRAEQSGNSKTSSTYSLSPGYRYDLGGGWEIDHEVRLSADYTTFRFPESSFSGNDLLFRRLDSQLRLGRLSSDSTSLGVSHRLRLQDQGTLEGKLYGPYEQSANSMLTLDTGFHIGSGIGVTPSYSYEYSVRDFLGSSAPSLEEHLHHFGLRSRMNVGKGALALQITRTFYSDGRPSYWKASVGFDYVP